MAEFGWAYVAGGAITGAAGPVDSVLVKKGSTDIKGTSNLVYDSSNNLLTVTGSVSASNNISASFFYGDGSNLENVGGAITALNNKVANRLVTIGSTTTELDGEANLIFNGSKLTVVGQTAVGEGAVSAGSAVIEITGSGDEVLFDVKDSGNANSILRITGRSYTPAQLSNKISSTFEFSSSANVSASAFYGNSLVLPNLSAGTATTSSYLALDSNNKVILTSSAGGSGGTIGAAEDGSYADGLFSTFAASTPIGTAIDKFNEILKILVPGPAPDVSRKNYTNAAGLGPKISIDNAAGGKPASYTLVSNLGDFQDSIAKNSEYSSSTSGNSFRLGVYEKDTHIVGDVNFHVVEQLKTSEINYSNKAFGNAESGSLKLEVNGVVVHTLNLTASGAGNPNSGSASDLNASGSGFTNLSVSSSATDQNGSEYSIFQHRTAKYKVHTSNQRDGFNYSRVIHTYGSVDYNTNYVQWFNDNGGSTSMTTVAGNLAFTGNGSKFLSGVEYFRSASVVYTSEIANFYINTYPTGNVVSFVNNLRVNAPSAQAAAELGGSDTYNTTLKVTASTTNNSDTILNNTMQLQTRVSHHFKPTFTGGSATVSGVLIYNVDTATSNLDEKFFMETQRVTSGSYDTQGAVTAGAATWSGENHMTASGASGHTDGLAFYGGQMVSPKNIVNNGNVAALANAPSNNPNYSGLSGTRTFYRKIQNTGGTIRDMKVTITKNTRINNSALTTNNVQMFIKIPGKTGWMDVSQNFTLGSYSDGNGALISGANDNANTGTTATGNSVHCVSFGLNEVANNEYVVIKVIADADWEKYISRMVFQLGASDVSAPTQAPDLDFIDFSGLAGEDAKLSFGASNPISGYTNVAGGGIGLDNIDFNENFVDNFSARRGVLEASGTITGILNQDISANTPNYPADSFGNAYTGSLILEVNGANVHTLDLTSSTSAIVNNFNANSSGFSVSGISYSETSDDIPDYTKPYRTGSYQIGHAEQRAGWNYARVKHVIGASTVNTAYVEWCIDQSGSTDNTAISNVTLTDFGHPTVWYQSGIGYFAVNPTASFSMEGSNFYSNVYSHASNAIRFPTQTNCTVSEIIQMKGTGLATTSSANGNLHPMPFLVGVDGCETTNIEVTGALQFNGGGSNLTSVSGGLGLFTKYDASVSGLITHPLKSTITTSTLTKTAIMYYSGSVGSSTLGNDEYFGSETYRVISGSYLSQSNVTSSANAWNPQTAMNNGGGHDDGMVSLRPRGTGYLISPFQIGKAGDTRNNAQGSTGLQAPNGNPNYSTLTNNTRTYYRYFKYTGVSTVASFTLTLYGDATLVGKTGTYSGTLGANKNCFVELKIPFDPNHSGADDQSTGWADCAKIFDASDQPNNDGAGIRSGETSGEDQSIDSNGLALTLTLGTRRIKQNQHVLVKISAHKDWVGYLSRIQVTY